jgi:flagellar hook-associated protein 3 FlgL
MAIRVTQNQIASQFNLDVSSIYARMAKTQQQLSDGRRITQPSDDPFGTGQVLGFDTQIADIKRFQANVGDSIGFMNAADSALDSVTSALQGIYEKAVQAANGTNGLQDLQSIATEIQQLKEVVRDGLNAQHGDSYIFGGTATGSEPFPAPANAYVGTNNTMSRRVGQNQSIQLNVPGDAIVGPNGTNTLDVIDQLILDVGANNVAGIQAAIASIQTQTDMALNVRTQLGATTSRLEVMQTRLDLTEERLLAARSDVADVDAAEAYMRFTQQQTMYQAALAAGTRIMQTSILDFI